MERAIYQEGASTLICAHFYFSTASLGDHSIICVHAQSCLSLSDPMDLAHQAPLSIGFSRQKYWNGLLFPSPGDLPNPEIEPGSPALLAYSLPSERPGKPNMYICMYVIYIIYNMYVTHYVYMITYSII